MFRRLRTAVLVGAVALAVVVVPAGASHAADCIFIDDMYVICW